MNVQAATRQPPITDSAWFWIYLFCTFGLVLSVVMERRIVDMMTRDRNQAAARQRAWQKQLGENPSVELESAQSIRRILRPLYFVIGASLAAAWIVLWWKRFRRTSSARTAVKGEPKP